VDCTLLVDTGHLMDCSSSHPTSCWRYLDLPRHHWSVWNCGVSPIATYIAKRKTILLHFAETYSPLYHLCLGSKPMASCSHHKVWWDR